MASPFVPTFAGIFLSGTTTVVIKDESYIIDYKAPGLEGDLNERRGSRTTRVDMTGFFDSGDSLRTSIAVYSGQWVSLTVPSSISGNYFISGYFLLERLDYDIDRGRGAPFYHWRMMGVLSGTPAIGAIVAGLSNISGQSVLILASGYFPLTMYSGSLNVNISGGAFSATTAGYDYSGLVTRNVGTIASGSTTIKVGNVWSYVYLNLGGSSSFANSGLFRAYSVTSGYTFLHSIMMVGTANSLFRGFSDAVSGSATGFATGTGVIFDNAGNSMGSGTIIMPFDIEVLSGLNVVVQSGAGAGMFTFFYKQAPLN